MLGLFLVCLSACESKHNEQTLATQSPSIIVAANEVSPTSLSGQSLTSDKLTHEKKSQPKPGAAVSLKSTTPLYVAALGTYEFDLPLISANQSGKMTVMVSANDGVTILSPEHKVEFVLQENGVYVVPLVLKISMEGRFYVQLHVSITKGEQSATRVIAAILQVGDPVMNAQKVASKRSAEEDAAVISLPAQETISPR